jgi:hypothetical protein
MATRCLGATDHLHGFPLVPKFAFARIATHQSLNILFDANGFDPFTASRCAP